MDNLGFWPVFAISIGGWVGGDIAAVRGLAAADALRRCGQCNPPRAPRRIWRCRGANGKLLGKSRWAYGEYARMKSEISGKN